MSERMTMRSLVTLLVAAVSYFVIVGGTAYLVFA